MGYSVSMTATRLRQNLYQILDTVLETGVPVEIERAGQLLRIVPVEVPSKWARLTPHDALTVDPQSIVEMDWSGEWRPDAVP
jgi:antitoxin (DNA-binding transcriptional repressor) of toxin-antitoxin stability system